MSSFPYIDDDTRPFWEGVERGELRGQRCGACRRAVFYPRAVCPHCGAAEPDWELFPPRALVHSHTTVHRATPPFDAEAPFVVALVEVGRDPDFRMMTRIVGCEPGEVEIGTEVELRVTALGDGPALPCFAPVPAGR